MLPSATVVRLQTLRVGVARLRCRAALLLISPLPLSRSAVHYTTLYLLCRACEAEETRSYSTCEIVYQLPIPGVFSNYTLCCTAGALQVAAKEALSMLPSLLRSAPALKVCGSEHIKYPRGDVVMLHASDHALFDSRFACLRVTRVDVLSCSIVCHHATLESLTLKGRCSRRFYFCSLTSN